MSANPSMMKHNTASVIDVRSQEPVIKSGKSIEYRMMYALVFMVCLAITGLCRLLPRNRHPWICAGDTGSSSLWNEARCAADSTVPYVFHKA